ncbi:MAG: tetratricopeptide repeat protein [Acidobacteria bacterium]|nr:tetratricopeptide repeat protein [Acidobacteriota bacterium]
MDIAGFASTRRAMRAIAILLILAFSSFPLRAQTLLSDPKPLAEIKQLIAEERWQEVVRLAEAEVDRSPDLNYYYGTALARLERWDDARRAFQNGLRQQPGDKRFSLELAGVAFKQKNYAEAADYLRRALRLDPEDTYANDFLASVYFLQGNLEAALKYWNLVSKPQIEEVRLEPTPRVDPVLLDHAFAFAPATVLGLPELQTTEARVGGLNIFPDYRFDLEARSDGKFDVVFRARERNGWGTRWGGLLSLFRGLPFQTIHPEFFNLRRRAINSESLIRWDAEKRRFRTDLSGPFSGESKWRYRLGLDLRNENWDVRHSFTGPAPLRGRLNLRKHAFAADVTSFVNGRWDWSTGVELSHRDYRDVTAGDALTPQLLAQGFQLKHLGQLNYELVRAPQRRFIITTGASTQLGRIWSQPSHLFAKLQGSIWASWFPQARGDDYEMQGKIRAGKTFGEIPFDELFVLGVERDNDLWLRSHIGTRDGRKGSAPLGRNYLLFNWEFDKNVYSNALIHIKLGPFLDSGKITDTSPGLGSKTWLWDMGAQAKVRVFGLGVAFSYGKDLRSGNNAFYVSMFR